MEDRSPLAPHTADPGELRDRIAAERGGRAYLVYRDDDGRQQIVVLDRDRLSIGRGAANDVALGWDREVSRLHAELERIGGVWTIADDGLSRNGTFSRGSRISGRTRLQDGDVVRVGGTTIAFCDPAAEDSRDRTVAGAPAPVPGRDQLTGTQIAILTALARPFKHGGIATPASNRRIAEELHLSVDAIKGHLRVLYAAFGLEALPQAEKRQRLVAAALDSGIVVAREL